MNLFYLRYFVTLAHVQHYTKAAEQLCITQPSLSHAIMQLEKELGVPLFEKSGRNTALTPFGREFLRCAEHTLSVLDEGVEALKRSARGEGLIRLGFLRTLGVDFIPTMAADFLKEHPTEDLRFTFHTGMSSQLIEGLKTRQFDLVFCSSPTPEDRLAAVPVGGQRLVLIVPKGHPLADKKSIRLQETLPHPQIGFSRDSGMRQVVEEMFHKIGAQPELAYETEEDQVIAGLVARGFGIAVVPYMELLEKLNLSVLKIQEPQWERRFYMIHDPKAYMPPVVRRFQEYVLQKTGKWAELSIQRTDDAVL